MIPLANKSGKPSHDNYFSKNIEFIPIFDDTLRQTLPKLHPAQSLPKRKSRRSRYILNVSEIVDPYARWDREACPAGLRFLVQGQRMRTFEHTIICVVLAIAPFVGIGCVLNRGGPPKLTRKEPKIFAVQREKPLSSSANTKNQNSPSDESAKTEVPTTTPEIASVEATANQLAKADGQPKSTKIAAKPKKREREVAVAVLTSKPQPESITTSDTSTPNAVSSPSNVTVSQDSSVTPVQFSDASENKPELSQIKLSGHKESTDSESDEIEFEVPKPVSSPTVNPEVPERAWDAPDADEIEESFGTSASSKADEWNSPDGFDVNIEKTEERDFQRVCLVKFREERIFIPGLPEFTVEHQAQRYRFSSKEAAEKFQATPEQFVPTAGGLDIVAFGNSQEVIHGSLDFAVWYNKRLFLFSNHENIAAFQRQPEKFTAIK